MGESIKSFLSSISVVWSLLFLDMSVLIIWLYFLKNMVLGAIIPIIYYVLLTSSTIILIYLTFVLSQTNKHYWQIFKNASYEHNIKCNKFMPWHLFFINYELSGIVDGRNLWINSFYLGDIFSTTSRRYSRQGDIGIPSIGSTVKIGIAHG